jgi:hypothetical protein
MTLLVVTSARMILVLLGTSGLGMIGAGLRAAKVFWPASFVLWLHTSVSMRFRVHYRSLYLMGGISLMRHWAIVAMAIMRIA